MNPNYNPRFNEGFSQGPGFAQQPQGVGSGARIPGFGATGDGFAVSPQMLNYGLGVGQEMISKQRDKWMPGVSGFWNSLKIYFAVNNDFVIKRLATVLYPYSNKNFFRIPADEVTDGVYRLIIYFKLSVVQADSNSHKWALPREDMNAPDLYVPLMSFITYILLYGLVRGIYDANFSPEMLIQAVWRCCLLQCIEVLVMKLGLGMMQASIPFLDMFSYTGYKYVGLCVVTVAKLLGTLAKMFATLYCAFMLAVFFLGSVRSVVPANENGPVPRHILLLALAGVQFVVTFALGALY